jgi:hypothetical protein
MVQNGSDIEWSDFKTPLNCQSIWWHPAVKKLLSNFWPGHLKARSGLNTTNQKIKKFSLIFIPVFRFLKM